VLPELEDLVATIQSCRSVAQSGSASGLGPEGRRFESYRSDHELIENAPSKGLFYFWFNRLNNSDLPVAQSDRATAF
jgi:hypothetical protein